MPISLPHLDPGPRCRRPVSTLLGVVAVCCLAVFASQAAEPTAGAPDKLFSGAPPSEVAYPVWVAANAARGTETVLDTSLFEPGSLESLQTHVDNASDQLAPPPAKSVEMLSPDDCEVVTVTAPWSSTDEDTSLGALALGAHRVLAGEVIEVTPGFAFGSPATLLTVRLESTRQPLGKYSLAETVYIAYPQAAFRLDGVPFCGQHEREARPVPVGSRLLFLSAYPAADRDQRMFLGTTATMAVTAPDGTVVVGERLLYDDRRRSLRSIEELGLAIEQIRAGGDR